MRRALLAQPGCGSNASPRRSLIAISLPSPPRPGSVLPLNQEDEKMVRVMKPTWPRRSHLPRFHGPDRADSSTTSPNSIRLDRSTASSKIPRCWEPLRPEVAGQERAGIEEIVGLLRMYGLREPPGGGGGDVPLQADAEMVELAQAEISGMRPGWSGCGPRSAQVWSFPRSQTTART